MFLFCLVGLLDERPFPNVKGTLYQGTIFAGAAAASSGAVFRVNFFGGGGGGNHFCMA